MLFRLIKESEIWEKSHNPYLQEYTTWADGIAQTVGAKIKKRARVYAENNQVCYMEVA